MDWERSGRDGLLITGPRLGLLKRSLLARHFLAHALCYGHDVGFGNSVDGDGGGWVAVELGENPVVFGSQFTPAHILDLNEPADLGSLDEDLLELLGVGETAVDVDGVFPAGSLRGRSGANLASGDLRVLVANGGDRFLRGDAQFLERVGVEPDSQAVVSRFAHRIVLEHAGEHRVITGSDEIPRSDHSLGGALGEWCLHRGVREVKLLGFHAGLGQIDSSLGSIPLRFDLQEIEIWCRP